MTNSTVNDHGQWSMALANTATHNSTPIHRNFNPESCPSLGYMGCQTLYEALRRGAAVNPLGPCLGFRAVSINGQATPFIYSSYTEVLSRVNALAAGLDAMNLVLPNEDGLKLLGIYMKNCMEWTIAEHAVYSIGGATVPCYDTLGPETVSFVLKQTNLSACVCTRKEVPQLVKAKQDGCDKFKFVIIIDGVLPETKELCESVGLRAISLAQVESTGDMASLSPVQSGKGHQHTPPSGGDICTFCYTSGTTGNPKGALLTHHNMMSAIAGLSEFGVLPNPTDRHLSYLPLPHIFERVVQGQMLLAGGSIGFFRGDPTKLLEDIQACRPTLMPVAPRVLNKIHDKIIAGINAAGGMKKKLFYAALRAKAEGLKQGYLKHSFYDHLIFNKIKKALGMDCLRFMVSGSAPLSEPVMVFFRCMLGIPVVEGYGQTEGAAAATLGHPSDCGTFGHVGGPVGSVEIKLVDVTDMGYFSTDTVHRGMPCQGRGEIWVRGPSIFKGYYKDEEKTQETITEDGWLMSGDIGLWNADGCLQIIDRKKNIFKLSQGEYVAAEKIENVLNQSLFIGQNFVYGDSYQSSLVAIVVPDEEVVMQWAVECGDQSLTGLSFQALCKTDALQTAIMTDIQAIAKRNGLHGFETPKAIFLEPEHFTAENGLTTPTFKLKRPQLKNHYKRQIDELYARVTVPPSKL
jgi:Long-chain acyl-CoA synthetases (AMP-forming)